jgi:4'-phosphopantetheinyl transferase EntD
VALAALTGRRPDIPWSCLLFSAKESVYKAWYPLMKTGLDFGQVEVGLRDDGSFDVRILRELPGQVGALEHTGELVWQGRWALDQGFALTSMVVLAFRSGSLAKTLTLSCADGLGFDRSPGWLSSLAKT